MYPDWVNSVLAGFLVIWLGGLSFLVWKQNGFLKSLFPKSGGRDIRKKFEEVLKQVWQLKEETVGLKDHLSKIENLGLKHIQRVELIRFNPYDDTGGDQSFSLAMLDDKGSGVVITSLHARSGTRVFAKPISSGGANKHRLSEEEEQVVKKAML